MEAPHPWQGWNPNPEQRPQTIQGYYTTITAMDRATRLPGRSFAHALCGEACNRADKAIVICDEYGPSRMLRTTNWRYVHRYPDGPDALYHLAQDPGETQNLADRPEYKDVRTAMLTELDCWFEHYALAERDGSRLYACKGKGQLNVVDARTGSDGSLFT